MFSEFSLSLKNVKKLTNQQDDSQTSMNHVSDYADKVEKSRNYI